MSLLPPIENVNADLKAQDNRKEKTSKLKREKIISKGNDSRSTSHLRKHNLLCVDVIVPMYRAAERAVGAPKMSALNCIIFPDNFKIML